MAVVGPDEVEIPCIKCGTRVRIPGARVRAATRLSEDVAVFCSRRCNVHYVAEQGQKEQERAAKEAPNA